MKKIIYIIVFCVILTGCGLQSMRQNKPLVKRGENTTSKEIVNELAETTGKRNTLYNVVYDEDIKVNGKMKKLQVLQNKTDILDTVLYFGNNQVLLHRVSIDCGYAHLETEMTDITGDKKKELVLKLYGGASGNIADIQIFAERKGKWTEIATPDYLWKEDNIRVRSQKKGIVWITIPKTKFKKRITVNSKEKPMRGYRMCKVKKRRVKICDEIVCGTVGNVQAMVTQVVQYNAMKDSFEHIDTTVKKH